MMKGPLPAIVFGGLLLFAVSCSSQGGTDQPAAGTTDQAAAAATPAAAAGTPYDCDKFSLNLADGWEGGPFEMGMANILPKGKMSPGLYFKFEGDGNAVGTAEESINTMIEQHQGTPMESKPIGGMDFKTTTYSSNGSKQTMFVAYKDGTKITITVEGEGAMDNPDIKMMLDSVKLK